MGALPTSLGAGTGVPANPAALIPQLQGELAQLSGEDPNGGASSNLPSFASQPSQNGSQSGAQNSAQNPQQQMQQMIAELEQKLQQDIQKGDQQAALQDLQELVSLLGQANGNNSASGNGGSGMPGPSGGGLGTDPMGTPIQAASTAPPGGGGGGGSAMPMGGGGGAPADGSSGGGAPSAGGGNSSPQGTNNAPQQPLNTPTGPLSSSTAVPSQNGFAKGLLAKIGAPDTPQNLKFLDAWQKAEGGSADNPFNTTQDAPGASTFNSAGVKRYPSVQEGLNATAQTLLNGKYGNIVSSLRQGTSAQQSAQALANSPWGTGSLVEQIVG
jgi:hypothetical protein